MSDLLDRILSTFPANDDVGVPLLANVILVLSGLDYDTSSITDGLFLEGPDTDQYVGPGLIDQVYPNNISQGDVDDFLMSPGFKGIVEGEITVTGVDGNTQVTFNPTLPFAALTEYIINLTSITTSGLDDIDGYVTFSFETGSGSIEEVPSSVSSSVLADTFTDQELSDTSVALSVVKTTPVDHSVEQSVDLREIVIEFNKAVDPASIHQATVEVEGLPATDHPNATITSSGSIAKTLELSGNILRIKI